MPKTKVLLQMTSHLTKAEKEAREVAEGRFERDEVLIEMPEYLYEDLQGQDIWNRSLQDAYEFGLFDNLDREVLGSYCSITSRLISLRQKYSSAIKGHRKNSDVLDISKEIRQLESLQLNYAGRLGLTPESRARLSSRTVEPEKQDSDFDLYGYG